MNPAIKVKNLTKCYGSTSAVENLSFEIQSGEFAAFLGPNGAGKTTTIGCITGLCNFAQGSIEVFSHDVIQDYKSARKLIGLCPQEFNLDPFLTIEQLLRYQAGYFGIPPKQALERARELLQEFELWDKKDQDFRKLSGGMKRRLLLCRSLVHSPKILILDEPTAGADLEVRHKIWDYLTRLNHQGVTILLTTHYMEEAEKLSEKTYIINHGKLIYSDKTKSLLENSSLEKKFIELTKQANHV